MKKKGFTLSEVLIAVCIIGVISAIMASAFNHVKPDKTKMLYIKAHDAFMTAIGTMVNDSTLFSTQINSNSETVYDISNTPFLDINYPTNPYYYNQNLNLNGNGKFARLLCYTMNGEVAGNNNTCSDLPESNAIFRTGPGNMRWTVQPVNNRVLNNDSARNTYQVNLEIINNENDIRNLGGFCVQPDGEVRIIGQIGATYIKNRKKIRGGVNDVSAVLNTDYIEACEANTYPVTQDDSGIYTVSDEPGESYTDPNNPANPGGGH